MKSGRGAASGLAMGSRCRRLVTGKVCTQHYQLIGDSIGARFASCANNASKPEERPSVLAAVIDSESQVEWIMHPEREGEKKKEKKKQHLRL